MRFSKTPNRVRELREARGLTQMALAQATQLTRQSVSAIEAGRATPAVDVALRVARALDCSVEDLFGATEEDAAIMTEPASASTVGRVAVAHVGGRWVSHRLDRDGLRTSADALAGLGRLHAKSARGVEAELMRSSSEVRENVVMMGCAGGLGLLADRLNSRPGPGRFLWLSRSSTEALRALAKNQTHVAGVHLVDAKTGDVNVADVRRIVCGDARGERTVVLITLARWEVGLVVAPGNPKQIRSVADLGRRGLRLVVRETGAGARRLLERELRSAGVPVAVAKSAPICASGHLEVAQTIAIGAGDSGIATRDAAITFGLDFVPLAEERYDLALSLEGLGDARLQRLFDVLSSAGLRRELSSLGYDVRSCGDRVAEVRAA